MIEWGRGGRNVTSYTIGLFIQNATEAGGQSKRGSWSRVLCVLAFDIMCCVWKKICKRVSQRKKETGRLVVYRQAAG